jgi:hypothetical protein
MYLHEAPWAHSRLKNILHLKLLMANTCSALYHVMHRRFVAHPINKRQITIQGKNIWEAATCCNFNLIPCIQIECQLKIDIETWQRVQQVCDVILIHMASPYQRFHWMCASFEGGVVVYSLGFKSVPNHIFGYYLEADTSMAKARQRWYYKYMPNLKWKPHSDGLLVLKYTLCNTWKLIYLVGKSCNSGQTQRTNKTIPITTWCISDRRHIIRIATFTEPIAIQS